MQDGGSTYFVFMAKLFIVIEPRLDKNCVILLSYILINER
jgi:hypothetical protein